MAHTLFIMPKAGMRLESREVENIVISQRTSTKGWLHKTNPKIN